jgi:hypothetical protein
MNPLYFWVANNLCLLPDLSNKAFRQCDQIGQNYGTLATLGSFLLNQFSPKQAVSALVSKGF